MPKDALAKLKERGTTFRPVETKKQPGDLVLTSWAKPVEKVKL